MTRTMWIAGFAFMLTACSGDTAPVPLPTVDDADAEPLALIGGELAIDAEAGCAWLEVENAPGTEDGRLSVRWPVGYRLRVGKSAAVLDAQGREVAVAGDRLELAGGESRTAAMPEACRVSESVWSATRVRHEDR